jgi:hypothetical protein
MARYDMDVRHWDDGPAHVVAEYYFWPLNVSTPRWFDNNYAVRSWSSPIDRLWFRMRSLGLVRLRFMPRR